jgi:hypothetical protein
VKNVREIRRFAASAPVCCSSTWWWLSSASGNAASTGMRKEPSRLVWFQRRRSAEIEAHETVEM